MTAEDLLARLDGVRQSGRGWVARCPAHHDRNPSLNIHEGDRGLLLRCWTGCSYHDILAALGMEPSAGFYDDGERREENIPKAPKRRPCNWRRFAGELQDEALDHWLRGTAVLEAARGLNINAWTNGDIDKALKAVACAHIDLARADCLERLSVNIRAGGLRKEQDRGPQS